MKKKKFKGSRNQIALEQVNIIEVLDNLGIRYRTSGKDVSSDWIGTSCPFCGDNQYHLGLCLKSPVFSCWKCGTVGNILKYLAAELKSFSKAAKILECSVPREMRLYVSSEKERAVEVVLPKTATYKPRKEHIEFIKSRRFDLDELSDKLNLMFTFEDPDWGTRIIFPIMRGYKLLTFTSVDVMPDPDIKYRHLKDELSVLGIKETLFGLDRTNKKICILTEGLFDCLRLGDGAIASFGTKLTDSQIMILSKFQRVIVCMDGDEAGREGAKVVSAKLAPFCDVTVIDLPDGIDPDTLSESEVEEIRNA